MKVLLTGKTGFVGKNILYRLQQKYNVVAPSRQELDVKDSEAVRDFLKQGAFDVVLHLANPNPVKNSLDDLKNMFYDSLKIFMNFYENQNLYYKMIYLGSGAEFDKRRDIAYFKEEVSNKSIPVDEYGFGKYVMNQLAIKSNNIHNFRIFACYGPYDHNSKFITHAINCCMRNEAITIRQDCVFDYMHVEDLFNIICWGIDNALEHHDYNICSGKRILLSEIAEKVCAQMHSTRGVRILNNGLNKEYTADNSRLLNEMGKYKFLTIDEGISKQITWQRSNTI
jgi:UDP-glucose 4-epimerase